MKKICFVTAARSEYGLMKWLMADIDKSDEFELQIIVTGGHLLKEQGYTINAIKEDGFKIDFEIDSLLDYETQEKIAASMGRMAEGMARALGELKPDFLAVLGDRYELLPVVNSAFVMGIPIIHISGGDVTEGAIDDGIRNTVTMLASYHFPGTIDSYNNICRMRGSSKNVWSVGETSIDNFYREKLLKKAEISKLLELRMDSKWILMTYHPETMSSLEYNMETLKNCCNALINLCDCQVIATFANTDFGGDKINEYLIRQEKENAKQFKVAPSLGNAVYLSLMNCVEFVIGNSSSGIVEAPHLKKPVVNIGKRQKGRHLCENIIQSDTNYEAIVDSIKKAQKMKCDFQDSEYWGDGHTSERICGILKNIIGGETK